LSNLDAHLREEMRFEIRRVHDELGITTVYVTHDQGEALVTADQVAVMQSGVVQQLGTPEEIFEQPANTFVASFIGTNNEIEGTLEAPGIIRIGQSRVHGLARSEAPLGAKATLCIRPSKVEIGEYDDKQNLLRGTVSRSAYLGEYRDVLIDLPSGGSLRAFVPPRIKLVAGEAVAMRLPAESCHIYSNA
jgi:iron(III) transport system ATP-binding protein